MKNKEYFFTNLVNCFKSSSCALTLIGIGIFLRLGHYLENRSLWADEAWVSNVIIKRSFKDILFALNIDRHDPLGFGLIEKFFITILGNGEYALRLFPFLCSIASLFLFYNIVRKLFKPLTVTVAIGLFTFCDGLIYYAAEVHPYSSDVLASLIVFWLYTSIFKSGANLNLRDILLAGLTGGLLTWVSYPSVFVLAGVGLTLLLRSFIKNDRQSLCMLLIIFLFWTGSFIFYYLHYLDTVTHYSYMKPWITSLNPYMPLSLKWTKTFAGIILNSFKHPLGLLSSWLAILVFIIGSFSLVKKDKELLCIFLSPIILTLIAFSLKIYPFHNRLILFLTPFMIIILAEGALFSADRNKTEPLKLSTSKTGVFTGSIKFKIITPALIFLIFIMPVFKAGYYLFHKRSITEIRPLMKYLNSEIKQSDALYLNDAAQYAYLYYLNRLNFENKSRRIGIFSDRLVNEGPRTFAHFLYEDWEFVNQRDFFIKVHLDTNTKIYQDSTGILAQNQRAWFILSQVSAGQEKFLIRYLNTIGRKLNEVRSHKAVLLLYNLGE